MSRGIKITLIIAAVCIALSLVLMGIAFLISGGALIDEFENTVEYSTDNFDIIIDNDDYGYSENVSTSNSVIITDTISAIEIEWVSGTVDITVGGDEITVFENSAGQIIDNEQMSCRVENGTLKIDYDTREFYFGIDFSDNDKDLTVTVPEAIAADITRISVESVSADVRVSKLSPYDFDIETVSGNIYVSDITADEADISAVSGNIEVTGAQFSSLDASNTSGKIRLSFTPIPRELDIESVSGDIELYIPEGNGFDLEFETASGDLTLEHPSVKQGGRYIVNGGGPEVNIDTTSGDVFVRIN